MATYTTQIRSICNTLTGHDENTSYRIVITEACPLIFNFKFPFWGDEEELLAFEKDFLRHFYMREIGQETVQLWKLMLEDTLNLIMPKYIPLAQALNQKLNILITNYENETEERTLNKSDDLNENVNHQIGSQRSQTSNRNVDETSSLSSESEGNTTSNTTGSSTSNASSSQTSDENQKVLTDGSITTNSNDLQGHSSTPQTSLQNALDLKYLDAVQTDKKEDAQTNNQTVTTTGDTSTHGTNDITASDTAKTVSDSSASSTQQNKRNQIDIYNDGISSTETGKNTRKQTVNGSISEIVKRGKEGRYGRSVAQLIGEYVENMQSLKLMIFNECEDLFMLLY